MKLKDYIENMPKYFLIATLIFLCILLSYPVKAETTIQVIQSHHDSGNDHNKEHYGITFKYGNIHTTILNKNSYGDPVITTGKMWNLSEYGKLELGLYTGVVIGYKDHLANVAGVSPYGWFDMNYRADSRYSFHLRMVPGIYAFALEYKL